MSQEERPENRNVPNMQVAGKALCELRSKTALSLHGLSALAGVDVSLLSRAERGLSRTSDRVLDIYFEAAGLDEFNRTYYETYIKIMWGQAPRGLTKEEARSFAELRHPDRSLADIGS